MHRFSNILCVLDADDHSPTAINRAVSLARNHQAALTVLTVAPRPHLLKPFFRTKTDSDQFLAGYMADRKTGLDDFVRQHCQGMEVATEILTGIPFLEIIRDVLRNNRDLVIKCPGQIGGLRRLFGSDDMQLLRKCPCPLLMLKPEQTHTFRKILATVDVSDSVTQAEEEHRAQEQLNRQVLAFSAAFALAESAELHVGSAWEAYGESFLRYAAFPRLSAEQVDKHVEEVRRDISDKLDACMSDMESDIGKEALQHLNPRVHLVKGSPAREIPAMVHDEHMDLIVMGTIARTGIPGLIIGNTAESILHQVDCSVLAIKPAGFQSTVVAA